MLDPLLASAFLLCYNLSFNIQVEQKPLNGTVDVMGGRWSVSAEVNF